MNKMTFKAILLASAVMAMPVVAHAQLKDAEPPADAPAPESIGLVSDAEANASATDAQIALLNAQLSALQAQIDDMKKGVAKATPAWKGAPFFEDKSAGFGFKVRGRMQLDSYYMGSPTNVVRRDLGFNTRVRRVRLGVEGSLPAGFGYKAEMDFANAGVSAKDVVLTYNKSGSPITFILGNQESLDGMEQMSSSRWSSFIERAQINGAFGNERRLGLSVGYRSKDNLLNAAAGVFSSHTIDSTLNNQGWIGAARISYAPPVLNGFVHIGANFQHREFAKNDTSGGTNSITAAGSLPSVGQLLTYGAAPFSTSTGIKYVSTGAFAAKGDDIFGGELYGVFKSLHVGGEVQYVKVNAYKAGDIQTGLNAFAGGNTALVANGNPNFFGGHFEVGYFLTGETRGYKNGVWDRTKVLNPLGKGGMGAFQIIGRVDYLNLDSAKLKSGFTNNFTTGVATASNSATRGGKQIGYLAGVTWMPTDYVRFLLNYIHNEVRGGPISTTVGKHSYSTDSAALRAQFDF